MNRWIRAAFCGLALAFAIGCGSAQRSTGVPPAQAAIFRGEWFDYYNRGLSRLAAGETAAAEADFAAAASLRPEDAHRARTYGVRFQDYYPRRELGILSLRRGDYENARRQLERSYAAAPSPTTGHFLDAARAEWIRATGADSAPPVIEIAPPLVPVAVDPVLKLRGVARDDTFVAAVRVNGVAQYRERAEPEVAWESDVPLRQGRNRIVIHAEDLAGRVTEEWVEVELDTMGPSVSVEDLRISRAGADSLSVHLSLRVYDPNNTRQIRIEDRAFPLAAREERVQADLTVAEGAARIRFEAVDALGNRTHGELALHEGGGEARTGGSVGLDDRRVALLGGAPAFLSLAAVLPPPPAGIFAADGDAPRKVFHKEFILDGHASDPAGIVAIHINGEAVPALPGRQVFFSHGAVLAEGTNCFVLEAENGEGEWRRREVTILFEPPASRSLASRLRVGMLDDSFLAVGDVPQSVSAAFLAAFPQRMRSLERFRVVERNMLDAIARERLLAALGRGAPRADIREGIMESADLLLHGAIRDVSHGYEFVVNVVDVQAWDEPVPPLRAYHPGRELEPERLDWACRGLALKVLDEFPLVEGVVVAVRGDQVRTSLNRSHQLRNRQHLFLLREEREEGRVVFEHDLGILEVNKVSPEGSQAKIVSLEDLAEETGVLASDVVITK